MNREVSSAVAVEAKSTSALHDRLDRLLAKAKPTKRELIYKSFRDLYPKLEAHLSGGKLLKDVLAAFNEVAQTKVCARKFNEMLDEERARRDSLGNPVRCLACGQRLNQTEKDDVAVPTASNSLSELAVSPLTLSE